LLKKFLYVKIKSVEVKMKKCFIFLFLLLFSADLAAQNIKVVDGDSLEIDGQRIRLDGIDAPEYKQICKDATGKDYACGQKALEFAQNFIAQSEVDCQCLPEKDRYQRELCECFVNEESLNKALVTAGWAVPYRADEYSAAQKEARRYKRGIWQGKNMRPALYRILQKPDLLF